MEEVEKKSKKGDKRYTPHAGMPLSPGRPKHIEVTFFKDPVANDFYDYIRRQRRLRKASELLILERAIRAWSRIREIDKIIEEEGFYTSSFTSQGKEIKKINPILALQKQYEAQFRDSLRELLATPDKEDKKGGNKIAGSKRVSTSNMNKALKDITDLMK